MINSNFISLWWRKKEEKSQNISLLYDGVLPYVARAIKDEFIFLHFEKKRGMCSIAVYDPFSVIGNRYFVCGGKIRVAKGNEKNHERKVKNFSEASEAQHANGISIIKVRRQRSGNKERRNCHWKFRRIKSQIAPREKGFPL